MKKNIDDCKKEILNDISRTISFRLCSIGVDLGLFEDLSINGPSSSKEIAFRKKYINKKELKKLADKYKNNSYGIYLSRLLKK